MQIDSDAFADNSKLIHMYVSNFCICITLSVYYACILRLKGILQIFEFDSLNLKWMNNFKSEYLRSIYSNRTVIRLWITLI